MVKLTKEQLERLPKVDPQRNLDAALDMILAQALRARSRAIEMDAVLMGPRMHEPGILGTASAFATLIELDVNELVRQIEKLTLVARSQPQGDSPELLTPDWCVTCDDVKVPHVRDDGHKCNQPVVAGVEDMAEYY